MKIKSPQEILKDLKEERFQEATVLLWAGSVSRNEGSESSDLDIIVIYENLPYSYHETFFYQGWPIDALVHDPYTLSYFIHTLDAQSYIPFLAKKIAEGIEITPPNILTRKIKKMAQDFLKKGPILNQGVIDFKRFKIADLIDNIKSTKDPHEKLSESIRLYEYFSEFYLLSHQKWIGEGKDLVRSVKAYEPQSSEKIYKAFQMLFTTGQVEEVELLSQEIMASYGGLRWDGFRWNFPSHWKEIKK